MHTLEWWFVSNFDLGVKAFKKNKNKKVDNKDGY